MPSLRGEIAPLGEASAHLDEAATAAGRDPAEIRRVVNVNGEITDGASQGLLRGPVDQWVDEPRTWQWGTASTHSCSGARARISSLVSPRRSCLPYVPRWPRSAAGPPSGRDKTPHSCTYVLTEGLLLANSLRN